MAAVLRLLDGGANLEDRDGTKETPLISAALAGHADIVAELIKRGADIKARNDRGLTPLHAALYGGSLETVQALVQAGAAVNDADDKFKVTPLILAAEENHADVVQLLIERGANLELQERHGYTALTRAGFKERWDIVAILLKSGGRVSAKRQGWRLVRRVQQTKSRTGAVAPEGVIFMNTKISMVFRPLGAAIGASMLLFAGSPAFAAEVNTGYFGNVAIEGYDTVAYFTDGKATKGSDKFAYEWLGATWQFSSDEHRKLFEADPISYAPQFGGLCAEGMADKEMTVNIEPEAWQIIDGKLYITAGARFGEDMKAIAPKAEANWPGVEALLSQ